MITRPDTFDMTGDHDMGLEHNHNWASERTGFRAHSPIASDAASIGVPSSVHHDDAIYVG